MLQVTILGCGSSLGVPVIGCRCQVCQSTSSYNKRTRSSIIISDSNSQILVDFGFDVKDQLVRAGITKLDAALLTHDHADHVSGIDNLRIFAGLQRRPLEIFTDHHSAAAIQQRYHYLFARRQLLARPVDFFANFDIGSINLQLFRQHHGSIDSLGVRVNDFVYSSDVIDFPAESTAFLKNIKVWVLDFFENKTNQAHAGLEQILKWNYQYQPEKIFLTHMSHHVDYHLISQQLPVNISPLYDGCQFVVGDN